MRGATRREIEVKLGFDSVAEARDALSRLEAVESRARCFEDNILLDRGSDPLLASGKLLRLRRYGADAVLTFKAPVPGVHKHKVREELETGVTDADSMRTILARLGFERSYRYQKYRTEFVAGPLHVSLDETPIGCFVELEGLPEQIDVATAKMGLSEERYVTASYRELHLRAARERGEVAGDMVFGHEGTDRR